MRQAEPRDALGRVTEGEVQVAVRSGPGCSGGVEPVPDPQRRQAQALDSSRGRNTGSPAPAIFAATWLIVCSSRVTLAAAAVASAVQHTRPTWYFHQPLLNRVKIN
jgi:hypothetical protein